MPAVLRISLRLETFLHHGKNVRFALSKEEVFLSKVTYVLPITAKGITV
jgi:hypothetical protein